MLKARLLAAWLALFCRHHRTSTWETEVESLCDDYGKIVSAMPVLGVNVQNDQWVQFTFCRNCGRLIRITTDKEEKGG